MLWSELLHVGSDGLYEQRGHGELGVDLDVFHASASGHVELMLWGFELGVGSFACRSFLIECFP